MPKMDGMVASDQMSAIDVVGGTTRNLKSSFFGLASAPLPPSFNARIILLKRTRLVLSHFLKART